MKGNNQSKISSQKYEQLIHEYQTKISSILKKNNDLSNEANDLINSIYLNRDIISDYLKDYPDYKTIEKNLIDSIENYLDNIDEKNKLEMQLNKLEHFQKNLPEEVELLQINNEHLKSELINTLKQIYKLQKDLEKHKKNALFKIPREEIFVISPTKKNIELLDTITKLSKDIENNHMQEIDKREIKLLDAKIQIIEEQVDKLKQKINNDKNKNDNDIINNNENEGNENDEIEEIDEEKGVELLDGEDEVNEECDNEIKIIGNKNYDNDNMELIEQIKYFTKEVEKLEKENDETKNKIKEYNEEYNKLKDELKSLNFFNGKATNNYNSTSYRTSKINNYNKDYNK
jgi:chromosome segregation ATPase